MYKTTTISRRNMATGVLAKVHKTLVKVLIPATITELVLMLLMMSGIVGAHSYTSFFGQVTTIGFVAVVGIAVLTIIVDMASHLADAVAYK